MNHNEPHPSWPAPETSGAVRPGNRGERRPTLSVPVPVDLSPAWVSAPPVVRDSSEWPDMAVRRRVSNPPSARMVFGSLLVFIGLGTASFGALYASVHANDRRGVEEPQLVDMAPYPRTVPPPAQEALAVPSAPVEPAVTTAPEAAPAPMIAPAPRAIPARSTAIPTPLAKRAHAKARTVVHIEPTPSYPKSALGEATNPAAGEGEDNPVLDPAAPAMLETTPTTGARPTEFAVRGAPSAPAVTAPVPSASAIHDNALPAPADDVFGERK